MKPNSKRDDNPYLPVAVEKGSKGLAVNISHCKYKNEPPVFLVPVSHVVHVGLVCPYQERATKCPYQSDDLVGAHI